MFFINTLPRVWLAQAGRRNLGSSANCFSRLSDTCLGKDVCRAMVPVTTH
jgi:hypothetical protein